MGHLNVRSIFPKIDFLRHHLSEELNKMGIIGLSETWLTNQLPDDLVSIPGFNLSRLDRTWSDDPVRNIPKKGGGVGLYIKDSIEFNYATFKPFNRSCKDIEIHWVHMPMKFAKDILVLNSYRPLSRDVT